MYRYMDRTLLRNVLVQNITVSKPIVTVQVYTMLPLKTGSVYTVYIRNVHGRNITVCEPMVTVQVYQAFP